MFGFTSCHFNNEMENSWNIDKFKYKSTWLEFWFDNLYMLRTRQTFKFVWCRRHRSETWIQCGGRFHRSTQLHFCDWQTSCTRCLKNKTWPNIRLLVGYKYYNFVCQLLQCSIGINDNKSTLFKECISRHSPLLRGLERPILLLDLFIGVTLAGTFVILNWKLL